MSTDTGHEERVMDILHPCCAGLDVHKDSVYACIRRLGPGGAACETIQVFGTMTPDLLQLGDWLAEAGVTHVAMESTGVYWKPVYYLLEGRFTLLLANAQQLKRVAGRKTDTQDCAWIAKLLQHGLIAASFVPPEPQRDLRELTRQRVQLVRQKATLANRIQKVLEGANLKLGSVASDVLGKSGRAMLRALIAGQTDPEALAELALGRLRKQLARLRPALTGRVTEHHRFLLRLLLDEVEMVEQFLGRLEARIAVVLGSFAEAVQRLTTIPGVDQRTAEAVVAEIGADMNRFPSEGHLASWAGMCPGNDESAGKRRSGKAPEGNAWLKRALVQAAWAASHTKGTYLSVFYRRLAARRGRKRALVALGHTLLGIMYQLLRKGEDYTDLGADYFDRRDREHLTRRLVRRLEGLGLKVTLEPEGEVA
jgi:transposase